MILELSGHAFRGYDKELKGLLKDAREMAEIVDKGLRQLAQLLEGKEVENLKPKKLDRKLEKLEEQVTADIHDILAKYTPSLAELRYLTSMVKYSAALRRMGGLVRRSLDRTARLPERIPNPLGAPMLKMIGITQVMLEDALKLIKQYDTDMAQEVMHKDEKVDQLYYELFRNLQQEMVKDPEKLKTKLQILMIARDIERMADHAFLLTKIDFFIHTGEKPKKKKLASV